MAKGSRGKAKGSKVVSHSSKVRLQFHIGHIACFLKKDRYTQCVSFSTPVYLSVVLEYLTAEVLERVENAARDNKNNRIVPRHLQLAIRNDVEISRLLSGVTISHVGCTRSKPSANNGPGWVRNDRRVI